MKRILIGTLLYLMVNGVYSQLQAQGPGQEKIEALKIAFITRQLQLTPEEAQKFWPVYNVYDDEMKQTLRNARQKGSSEIEVEEKILDLHKKYKPDFLKAISEEKFNLLMKAERSWGELLRKEMQRRRENGGRPGGPGRQGGPNQQ